MFDVGFYKYLNPELAKYDDKQLKNNFETEGWKNGQDPSPFFNVSAYLAQYPDVSEAKINPLAHYLEFGQNEGRIAYLSTWSGQADILMTRQELENFHAWIDPVALRDAQPALADLSDETVMSWYMMDGWREGLDPSNLFSTQFYLSTYDDVARGGQNPLLHFLQYGLSEGRFATQKASDFATPVVQQNELHADMDTVRSNFDAEWYRTSYPQVDGNDDALLEHYMTTGWSEGHDPSSDFSTAFYLAQYADIKGSGINPFLHYVQLGRKEGRRCSTGGPTRLGLSSEINLTPGLPDTAEYHFNGAEPLPPITVDKNAMDIHWIIPDFQAGSGGHMTIFRMVHYLEQFGHRNTIWIEKPAFHETGRKAWETIVKSFQCIEANVRFVSDALYETSGDVVIATAWNTAWIARNLTGFKARMYFVQDHEPEFYPTGSMSNLARLTYGFDLGCICASPWLENLMSQRYGRWARGFYLAYEPEQYFVAERKTTQEDATFKIAVYGRAHTDRRCVQLALAGLEILSGTRNDFEVHFFGQDNLPFTQTPFDAFNHGILNSDELSNLYNECDLGICFSGTNYSLVPQEMMACGLPLVEFDTESTRVTFPKDTVSFAGPAPVDIAAKVAVLMDSPTQLNHQRQAALNWVSSFSWKDSAQQVEGMIIDYLNHK